jgi:non-specific serine/threonine protein kinase
VFGCSGAQPGTATTALSAGPNLNTRTPEHPNTPGVEVLDGLASLVDKNLLNQEETPGGEPRFMMLETIREYGRECLAASGEETATRQRHADFYLALVKEAGAEVARARQAEWMDRLDREYGNLRAVLDWLTQSCEVEKALRLGAALLHFWQVRGSVREGRERVAGLLALPGAEARTAARANALNCAGILAWQQGDCEASRVFFDEELAISQELGDKWHIAASLRGLAWAALAQGDPGSGRLLFEENLAILRQMGRKRDIAWSLYALGLAARDQGDSRSARAISEESLDTFRELEDKQGIASSLSSLGAVLCDQGEYGTAQAQLEESLAIFREIGYKRGIAYSLLRHGAVAHGQGKYAAARALYEEGLVILLDVDDKRGIAMDLEGLAAVAVGQAQSRRAARLFGAAERVREAMGAPLPPADRAEHDRSVAAVRGALGEDAFAAAWAEGRAMSLEEATRYALED